MQVMVASDTVGSLSSARAGAAIGSGWAGADVRVLPIGESGDGFVPGYADLLGAEVEADVEHGCLVSHAGTAAEVAVQVAGSEVAGTAAADRHVPSRWARPLARILRERRPERLLVDLAGCRSTTPAPGCWPRWAPTADRPLDSGVEPLAGWRRLTCQPPGRGPGRSRAGRASCPRLRSSQPLLGLRGITSLAGRAAGLEPAELLATDAALDRFARLAAPEQAAAPGAGACGGLGFAVLALGGRLTTGPALAFASPAGRARGRGLSSWWSPAARSSTSPAAAGEWSRPRPSERRPRSAPAC